MNIEELIVQIDNISISNQKFITNDYIHGFNDAISDVIKILKEIPEKRGEWVYEHWCEFVCSECGKYSKENAKEKYCPNCGALMRTY